MVISELLVLKLKAVIVEFGLVVVRQAAETGVTEHLEKSVTGRVDEFTAGMIDIDREEADI